MKVKRTPTIDYLKALNEDIWKAEARDISTGFIAMPLVQIFIPRRRLYNTEWETILEAAQTNKLACSINNSDFGFRFQVSFFESPLAPGAPVDKPILVVGWKHVPKSIKDKVEHRNKDYDSAFSIYWKFFLAAFNPPENKELLELYGLPEVKYSSYYKY